METPHWQSVAKKAQEHRDTTIQQFLPPGVRDMKQKSARVDQLPQAILSPEEIYITERAPEALLLLLACGERSCEQVTEAFLRRAAVAQELTNCITELLPERALQRARDLDNYFRENGKTVGPLHGLPISVKEHLSMAGLTLSAGFISFYESPPYPIPAADATALQILWQAGCVFYVRTTEPQTIMHLETCSNLYGETTNPYNAELTSGGSSGGEGALLGLRGSCLGIGTDIGGSVRSPAANCGIWSLRPTSLRVPSGGVEDLTDGEEQILGTIGPMSTSLEGLSIFMKTIVDNRPWLVEPSLLPMAWRTPDQVCPTTYTAEKRLKVAVMWHDGIVRPHPPVQRALRELVAKLRDHDWVDVVDWMPWKHDEAWEIISSLYFPDGGATDAAVIDASGEPWLPLSRFIITDNPNVRELSRDELFKVVSKRDAYRAGYAKVWNDTATAHKTLPLRTNKPGEESSQGWPGDSSGTVDVILCPVGPGPAPRIGTSKYWSYTSTWNLLDWPALVFPATSVNVDLDGGENGWGREEVLSQQDGENWKLWDAGGGAKGWQGVPVGLQLVGRRGDDEKVIEIMSRIERALGGLPMK